MVQWYKIILRRHSALNNIKICISETASNCDDNKVASPVIFGKGPSINIITQSYIGQHSVKIIAYCHFYWELTYKILPSYSFSSYQMVGCFACRWIVVFL